VSGLRRDELADLAALSEEHLKRLEQGRRHPSAGVVDALATALRLDPGDHERLSRAAGFAGPHGHRSGPVPRELTPPARRMLERIIDVPACVCDATWTVLAGNHVWTALGCGAGTGRGRDRNMAWRTFTGAPTTVFRTPERLTAFRSAIVAGLRAAADRYPADPELRDLIRDLRTLSTDFDHLWYAGTPDAPADRLTVRHPLAGPFTLDKDVLIVEPGDLRLVVLTAPIGSPDAERLATAAT
jgi:hypothetical protein